MARYAVLGEDRSDAETLQVLIRAIAQNDRLPIKLKGYDGCGVLLRKAARDLDEFLGLGCERFIVAYDADRADPNARRELVRATSSHARASSRTPAASSSPCKRSRRGCSPTSRRLRKSGRAGVRTRSHIPKGSAIRRSTSRS